MMGVLIHVLGDAANNLGVIIAALVIWKATYDGRHYADPAVSYGDCDCDPPLVASSRYVASADSRESC
jgi:hypothetical protein